MTTSHAMRVRSRRNTFIVTVALVLANQGVWAQRGGDPTGLWLTESGTSKVRIARCGGGYCGTLASTAGAGLDNNNPDPALKGRKLVGVQILNAATPTSGGFEGSLYNPNDGKTYSGSMTLKGPDSLEVSGCVLRVICKRQNWTRVR